VSAVRTADVTLQEVTLNFRQILHPGFVVWLDRNCEMTDVS